MTTDSDVLQIALIENIQREDLNPIEEAHAYHQLHEDFGLTQEEISRRFATKGANKFADLNWRVGSNGAALIEGALASVECKITQCHEGGDHTIVVGEILKVAANGDRPLLFFKGQYQKLPAS